tara:strand:- start:422 stop:697 length:276 start_codon:yes stop_codon:yes gene_type:complete
MKLKNAIDWSKVNYDKFKKERRNSLDKFPKTKLELIEDIERFITTNLERVDIDKNQHRIDWKDDEYIVFQVESMLQDVIVKLQTIKLEDIK